MMEALVLVAGYVAAFAVGCLVTVGLGVYCWWREQREPPARIIRLDDGQGS